tara:strand:- start:22 stop:768 length:747 start_codon:yes stop_codon:yes gene_type:complete
LQTFPLFAWQPPSPPPPPIAPLGASADMSSLKPARIFFAMGPSPNMQTLYALPGESDAVSMVPYRNRRHLQSQDADGEGAEIIDASDDPLIIDACSKPHPNGDELSLCETNGYENAVRLTPPQTRVAHPMLTGRRFATRADNCARLHVLAVDHVRFGGGARPARAAAHDVQVWRAAALAATSAAAAAASAAALAAALATQAAAAALGAAAALPVCLHRLVRLVQLLRQARAHGLQRRLCAFTPQTTAP